MLRLYVSMGGLPVEAGGEGHGMSLVVRNVTPEGERRSASVGFERPGGGEERAVGAEMCLVEEGQHLLVSPVGGFPLARARTCAAISSAGG